MALAQRVREITIEPETTRSKRRRRPSGEPPPLPRNLASGKYWLGLMGVAILSWVGLLFVGDAGAIMTRFEMPLLEGFESIRTGVMTRIARAVHALGSDWVTIVLRWGVILALVFFKRFRHLFVFIGSVLGVGLVAAVVSHQASRPRPLGIEIIGHWEGAAHPSRPVAALAVTMLAIAYTLVVPGRARTIAKWITGSSLISLAIAHLYLGIAHLTDLIAAIVIGVVIPLIAFRMLTPNEVFPVTYNKRRGAHLDIEGPRGGAIRRAVEAQIGVSVTDVCYFGLGGSAGSTPLRLHLAGEPPQEMFAKLYAQNHLRADRWYKLGRTLLYGRLEDEGSFSTVRRLVQYEDYMLHVMRDAGLPTPRPFGIVEITPELEYLLLTDFVHGATELIEADVTDDVMDQAFEIVRKLWDGGLAHRDIKPSNLLVAEGKVHLIDVAFGEVRPSPWRQAVDLANMMLVLALRGDAERVWSAALKHFTPEDVAEAFAATRGLTIPSQTRALMKENGRDLLAEFRAFIPKRRPISIQRWSLRRLALTGTVLVTGLAGIALALSNFPGAGLFPSSEGATSAYSSLTRTPSCGEVTDPLILVAQSVPTASRVPCVEPLPVGWSFGGADVTDGRTRIFLESDRADLRAVEVTFTAECDVSAATEVPSTRPGIKRLEQVNLRRDRYAGTRYRVFQGGCVAFGFDLYGVGRTALADEATLAVNFVERAAIDTALRENIGLGL